MQTLYLLTHLFIYSHLMKRNPEKINKLVSSRDLKKSQIKILRDRKIQGLGIRKHKKRVNCTIIILTHKKTRGTSKHIVYLSNYI